MSAAVSPVVLLTAALSLGLLAWSFWIKVGPVRAPPGVNLVKFTGDNSTERYKKEAGALLTQGYDKHTRNGQPFCIRDVSNPGRTRVFLPVKYMEEVRNAPQEKLSLPAILKYTSPLTQAGGPVITEAVQTTARVDLNRSLNKLVEPMQTLCFQAAHEKMPAYPEWTSVVLYPKIFELFSHMSARVMVGPELCDGWPAISTKYITRVLAAQQAIRNKYYHGFYWAAYYMSPEVAKVLEARREAAEFVRPVLEARQAAHAAHGADAEKHDDFLHWIMDNFIAKGKKLSPDEAVQNIFVVMFASMHGTSFIALQSLFSVLGTPGALPEIREEISRVSKNELKDSPVWTRHALGELRTMDSFMKESLRMRPFQEASVERVALSSYTFKDGLRIPGGSVVSFPSLRHNLDPHGANIPEAGTFDGKRWLKRRAGFDVSKFQFASTAENAFEWGGGPHACPGRFMADVTIKLMLICLITKYDMKLPESNADRPTDKKQWLLLSPDTSTPVLLRDVQD